MRHTAVELSLVPLNEPRVAMGRPGDITPMGVEEHGNLSGAMADAN